MSGFFRRATLRSLDTIERVGNRLPDPVTLFVIMIALVMFASWVAAVAGAGAVHPGTGEAVAPVNLFSGEQVRRILTQMPQTFAAFPPLGLVLVVMLGIGVAERSGLIETALKAFVRSVPAQLVTASVVLAGMLSSIAVDAGYVVLIPLGAVIFHGVGRHPIAGLAAAFAGVSGGFSANLLLTSLDPLLAGFTTPAAQILNPAYVVFPTANWYLMAALVPVFTIAGTVVTERVLEPRLGEYHGDVPPAEGDDSLRPEQRRGLIAAGLVVLLAVVAIAVMAVPENGVLRDPEGVLLVQQISPLLNSIVALMFLVFLLPGLAYGIVTGSIRSDRDVATMTADTMGTLGSYIVLAFVAAHLVAFFNWSNMGVITAISGAGFLQSVGFTGIPLIVAFVIVSSVLNLFIGSASAKWAIMAPIFVPMLMLLGYSPELTQAAYRIGDSTTNILTPLLPYFPLVIVFAQKYDKQIGIGTILSAMLPYSIAFGIVGILTLVAWMVFGLPLGPGAPLQYIMP
ncbi:MAG: AbgT family transporter [Gemmatimonadetes bacterium]|nr:AbgT family transporter [Gemmatimonadota bacterium]